MLFQRKKVKPKTITVSCTKRPLKTNTNIKLNFDLIAKIVQNKKNNLFAVQMENNVLMKIINDVHLFYNR